MVKNIGICQVGFTRLEMIFTVQGQELVLTGISLKKLKMLNGMPSEKLLKNAAHLCFLQLKEMPIVDMKGDHPLDDSTEGAEGE